MLNQVVPPCVRRVTFHFELPRHVGRLYCVSAMEDWGAVDADTDALCAVGEWGAVEEYASAIRAQAGTQAEAVEPYPRSTFLA